MSPEKIHLALNHFTFLFPLAALIPLTVGLIARNRVAMMSGLAIAAVGGLLTGPVMGSGEEAYERYKEGSVSVHMDAGAGPVLDHHEEVAHVWAKVMYGLALGSLLGLGIAFFKRTWLPYATLIVILLCIASVAAGLLIADSGGKIRRPDFRAEPESASLVANPTLTQGT